MTCFASVKSKAANLGCLWVGGRIFLNNKATSGAKVTWCVKQHLLHLYAPSPLYHHDRPIPLHTLHTSMPHPSHTHSSIHRHPTPPNPYSSPPQHPPQFTPVCPGMKVPSSLEEHSNIFAPFPPAPALAVVLHLIPILGSNPPYWTDSVLYESVLPTNI